MADKEGFTQNWSVEVISTDDGSLAIAGNVGDVQRHYCFCFRSYLEDLRILDRGLIRSFHRHSQSQVSRCKRKAFWIRRPVDSHLVGDSSNS
jgi:hypothetical protein